MSAGFKAFCQGNAINSALERQREQDQHILERYERWQHAMDLLHARGLERPKATIEQAKLWEQKVEQWRKP